MRVIPSTKKEWAGLATTALFPFKVYVVVVVPFYYVFRVFCPEPSRPTGATDGTGFALLNGFMLCGPALVVGAIVQCSILEGRAALRTLAFAALPVLLLMLILMRTH
jgi:hypothetical protein